MNTSATTNSKKKKRTTVGTSAVMTALKLNEAKKKAPSFTDVSTSGLKSAMTAHETAKPTAGAGSYGASLKKTVKTIADREPFSYDLDGDALYRRYKNEYLTAADRAMRDTVGAVSAQSGGYANSYAATAGSQAYGAEIGQLADIVPELYSLALDRYTAEGDDLARRYSILADADGTEYDRYRDDVDDWYRDAERLAELYESERDYEYGAAVDERDYNYQLSRDETEDAQWLAELEEKIRQYDENLAEEKRQFGESLAEEKRQHNTSLAEDARQYNTTLAQKESASDSDSDSEKSGGYSPTEQSAIMEELIGYKHDYDIAENEQDRQTAINRALAYLSGLKYPDLNAYFFEKVFGFIPEEYGGSGISFYDNYHRI